MTDEAFEELGLRLLEQELKANRYAKDYCQRMLKAAREFVQWLTHKRRVALSRIKRKDLMEYQGWLGSLAHAYTGKALSSSSLKHRYEAVKKLCSVLYRSAAISENPAHGLEFKRPEGKSFKRRPLSREEITLFLESIPTQASLRDRAFFELIYSSGLRMSEAVGLKVGTIDFPRREVLVRGKYDRERVVPLSDVARDFLLQYLGQRKDAVDEYVFPGSRAGGAAPVRRTSMSRIFRKLLEHCGIDKPELCTHSIRHSTATHLLDNGAGVRQVQELLGHKSIESTVLYTHVQTEGLARIYRKYHPREHELFEMKDASYEKRLEGILRDHRGRVLTGKLLPRRRRRK